MSRRKLGRWSFVCSCGWSSRNRGLATLHVTVAKDKAHQIKGIS